MYSELHTASGFSFLEGASDPESLVSTAARSGYEALALCDRDSVSGAPRFYKAAQQAGVRPLVGCEISLDEPGIKKGTPSAARNRRLTVLVENRRGYQNLCRLLTRMSTRAPKGEGRASWRDIEDFSVGLIAFVNDLRDADFVRSIFGPRQTYVELQRHMRREQERGNLARIEYARRYKLPLLATNGVRYARRSGKGLFDVMTCLRHKTVLDRAGRLLDSNTERYLKDPAAMAKLFADLPEAVHNTQELARRIQFTLENLGYEFPRYPLPPGETMTSYLRAITLRGARGRYRHTPHREKALRQIEYELRVIEKLKLEGYFLIVWDMVEFCRRSNILAQGRGSAANSAVCYSLGITAVDPVGMELLFERFLSEERGEWPDIDIDLPSGDQREKAIQHVYERYGASGAGMTANVITYRGKSAVREVGKVLGFPEEMIDRLSKCIHPFEYTDDHDSLTRQVSVAGLDPTHERVRHLVRLCREMQNLPRHLGQHSGGMVICQGDLDSVVPLENARMPNRRVVQWDKEDCADLGIIKVDLLGLGMMAVLEESIATIRSRGGSFDLAKIPPDDPKTYAMIQKADTVGVFQIESRAQMATLPRMKPVCFYDLVVEVAIIRPGPIVGDMAHPYLNRRQGRERVTYPHPSLEPILKRTLGVPLFQEQLLRMAMTAAGFTGGEAEELRRAMGFKRSVERMKEIEEKLRLGLAHNGISGAPAEQIVRSITSFALYGFPESHSASFALLAYASAYLKAHHTAEFTVAMLNCQPMGFYSPAVLVKDAQRHGVRVRPIDVQISDVRCTVEGDNEFRLGLMYVSSLRAEAAACIEQQRRHRQFTSVDDLVRRVSLRKPELDVLAEIGALNSLRTDMHRREALWQIEKAWRPRGPLLQNLEEEAEPCPLAPMTPMERLDADYRGSGMTTGPHPMHYLRQSLNALGVLSAAQLERHANGKRVRVAGAVIVRQRPGTAKGFLFLSMEDETGISNIIVRPPAFQEYRAILLSESFIMVEGVLQKQDGTIAVRAERIESVRNAPLVMESHDFH